MACGSVASGGSLGCPVGGTSPGCRWRIRLLAIHMADCTVDVLHPYICTILWEGYIVPIICSHYIIPLINGYICSRSDLKVHKEQSNLHDLEWQCFPGRCAFGCPRL